MEGRGGLSGNVAEEAFCLKSAPGCHALLLYVIASAMLTRLDQQK